MNTFIAWALLYLLCAFIFSLYMVRDMAKDGDSPRGEKHIVFAFSVLWPIVLIGFSGYIAGLFVKTHAGPHFKAAWRFAVDLAAMPYLEAEEAGLRERAAKTEAEIRAEYSVEGPIPGSTPRTEATWRTYV